jgi:glutathione peroxidase
MLTRRSVIGGITAAAATRGALAADISAHDFAFAGIDGDIVRLADWAGQPVLVVNTASRCGFTYQYDVLQALYDAYRDQGLVVLGVPSDDFGGQELATEAAVKEFCRVNFAIDFPMTEITAVKGPSPHPFYAWTARAAGRDGVPRWNFHKILIGPDGTVAAGFPSSVEPMSKKLRTAVEAALAAPTG